MLTHKVNCTVQDVCPAGDSPHRLESWVPTDCRCDLWQVVFSVPRFPHLTPPLATCTWEVFRRRSLCQLPPRLVQARCPTPTCRTSARSSNPKAAERAPRQLARSLRLSLHRLPSLLGEWGKLGSRSPVLAGVLGRGSSGATARCRHVSPASCLPPG